MDGGIWGTVIGSVLGFLGAVLPEVLRVYRGQQEIPEPSSFDSQGRVTDGEYVPGNSPTEMSPFVADHPLPYVVLDFLRASVRPVLTYAFFVAFVYIKLVVMYHALWVEGTPVVELMPILWDEGTSALFAAIITFWFGSRAMAKLR